MGARVDIRMRRGASMIVVGTVECCAIEKQVVVAVSWGFICGRIPHLQYIFVLMLLFDTVQTKAYRCCRRTFIPTRLSVTRSAPNCDPLVDDQDVSAHTYTSTASQSYVFPSNDNEGTLRLALLNRFMEYIFYI